MAGLGQTTAKLVQYRKKFARLVESANERSPARPRLAGGRLAEAGGFGSNPGSLRMFTHIPHDMPAHAPLVVVLHGCTQSAASYDVGAGWSELADRLGFAVLFAEQQRANNANGCFNWFLPGDISRGAGEALSIRQMIDRISRDHDLDARRVFVTGLSAGGAMAAVMLATYPEVFAGGAIIAGLPYGVAGNVQEALAAMFEGKDRSAAAWGDLVRRASDHDGPWPKISIWHGDGDKTVQPSNAGALVKQWTHLHALPETPDAVEMVNGHRRSSWQGPSGETAIEFYSIAGMGHGTPVASSGDDFKGGSPGPFFLDVGLSSTARLASFWGIDAEPLSRNRAVAASVESTPGPDVEGSEVGRHDGNRPRARPDDDMPRSAAGPRFSPHDVITRALRSAGLMKG